MTDVGVDGVYTVQLNICIDCIFRLHLKEKRKFAHNCPHNWFFVMFVQCKQSAKKSDYNLYTHAKFYNFANE